MAGFMLLAGCALPPQVKMAQEMETLGKNREAVDNYRSALAAMPESQKQDIQDSINRLLSKITSEVLDKAEMALGDGQSLALYEFALKILQADINYDDAQGRLAAAVKKYEAGQASLESKRQMLRSQAQEQIDAGKWADALSSIQAAKAIADKDDIAAMKNAAIKVRNAAYSRDIKNACQQEDWSKAMKLLDEFGQLSPRDSVYTPLVELVDKTKSNLVSREAQNLISKNKYFTAYTLILESEAKGCADIMGQIKRDGSDYYLEQARKEYDAGRLYYSYIASCKAKEFDSVSNDVFKFHRDREDEVDKSISVQVGIASFGSPVDEPDAGLSFSNALISYLTNTLPYGIYIMERSEIDRALDEKGRQMDQVVNLLGIHLAVVGNVSVLNVATDKSEREITQRVKIGTETVANPAYTAFVTQNGSDPSRWQMSPPPSTLEEDRFELIRFKRGKARMDGQMEVSVRMFTTSKGAITDSETFIIEDFVEDEFQDGVPEAGISEDSLDLPTEMNMRKNLRGKGVEEVAIWVLRNFEHREGRYFNIAENHLERREDDLALQALSQAYLYCCKEGIGPEDDNKWYDDIFQKAFFDLTE